MERQDEFLRDLLAISIEGPNQFVSSEQLLLTIQRKIEDRLPLLKPVCYENADLSSGLSGGGVHHICGDRASIDRVKLALHNESAFKPYVLMHREEQELRIALQQSLARIKRVIDA